MGKTSPHGCAVRVRSPPTAGGGFNCRTRFALPRFRAVIQLLFCQGSASRGDCPRKALVVARGTAGLPQGRRLVAQRRKTIQRHLQRKYPSTLRAGGRKKFTRAAPHRGGTKRKTQNTKKRPTGGVGRFGVPCRRRNAAGNGVKGSVNYFTCTFSVVTEPSL